MLINEEIQKCKEIMEFDKEMIIHKIAESLDTIEHGKPTSSDYFIAGLRYPEFLVGRNADDFDRKLNGAYHRVVNIYRPKLGIDGKWLIEKMSEIYGLN